MTPRSRCAGFRGVSACWSHVRRSAGLLGRNRGDIWFGVLTVIAPRRANAILDADRRRAFREMVAGAGVKLEPWQEQVIDAAYRGELRRRW